MLADKVEAGDFRQDRFPITDTIRADGESVTFTYTLAAAMQHAQVVLSRSNNEHDPSGRACALAGRKAAGHDVGEGYCVPCYADAITKRSN